MNQQRKKNSVNTQNVQKTKNKSSKKKTTSNRTGRTYIFFFTCGCWRHQPHPGMLSPTLRIGLVLHHPPWTTAFHLYPLSHCSSKKIFIFERKKMTIKNVERVFISLHVLYIGHMGQKMEQRTTTHRGSTAALGLAGLGSEVVERPFTVWLRVLV